LSDESPEEGTEDSPDDKGLPGVAAFAVMGSTIATCVGLGVVAGLWVDHAWHTSPGGLLVGIVLGTVAAVVSVVQQVRRYL